MKEQIADWPEEAREEYEERAAFLEYEAGYAREDAERIAFGIIKARLARGDIKVLPK